MAGTSLSFSPAAAQSRYKNEVLCFGQRGVSLTDSAANLRAHSRLRALDSCRDLFLYTWNAGGGTGVQSNPLWAGTGLFPLGANLGRPRIQGRPQSSGGVSINCVIPSELTLGHKPGFLVESSRLIRVLGIKTWATCAGTHPLNKVTVVVPWGWRNCSFSWKWSSFSEAVGYNPNCCFGELEQSTATRTGGGRNYFEGSQHSIYLYFY